MLLLLIGCDDIPDAFDMSMSAMDGGDKTVVFHGCHGGYTHGYLFCRFTDGAMPTQSLRLTFPKVNCSRKSCIEYRFFRKDGTPGVVAGVPKGETEARIALSDIVGTEGPMGHEENGEYLVQVRVWFYDKHKTEHHMMGEGLVRILILTPGYIPLGCASPEMGWITEIKAGCGLQVEHSTTYRSAICGRPC